MNILVKKLFSSVLVLFLINCSAPENYSASYNRDEIQSAQRTIKAEIVSKRAVKVKGDSGIGTTAGAATGYIAGSGIGTNASDNAIGAIAGALIGATVGSAIENQAQTVNATEYIIENDVIGLLTIIMTDSTFSKGSLVFVSLGSPPKIIGVAE